MTGRRTDKLVKGWCPGALQPMASGDGLIVRIRISGGIVTLALARQIAEWSRRWGNGQIDLSNRANLQIRGLSAQHLPNMHNALAECGLLGSTEAAEAVGNVISSPLAGLDPAAMLDVRPIAHGLEQRLAADPSLHRLPGKFGFAVDDGGSLRLDDVSADVRFLAHATVDGAAFAVHLAGAANHPLGPCRPDAVSDVAATIGHVFLRRRIGREAGIRRMRQLVVADGAAVVGNAAGLDHSGSFTRPSPLNRFGTVGAHRLGHSAYLGVGLPFGRLAAEDLAALVSSAAAVGAQEFRLTPFRTILVPVPSLRATRVLSDGLAAASFITDDADPRRRIAACAGAPACPRATTPIRADAAMLAAAMAGMPGEDAALHVSGCEKGCAHPGAATITLIGRHGRYDLVVDGGAAAAPVLRNLTLQQAAAWVRNDIAHRPRRGMT